MMRELFGQTTQALYRFADVMQMPDISGDTWTAYIQRKLTDQGITVAPKVVDEVLRHTGGHPYDTMKVCQALYNIARDQGTTHIDASIACLGIECVYSELSAVFQSELHGLDSIPHGRKILVRLARQQSVYPPGVNAGPVKKAVDKLVANGLIRRVSRGHYAFQKPMFQAYLVYQ